MTSDVSTSDELREFGIRPFVLIVKLDAPILERFKRAMRYRFPPLISSEITRSSLQVGQTSHPVRKIHHRARRGGIRTEPTPS